MADNNPKQTDTEVPVDDFDALFSRDFENDWGDEGDFNHTGELPKGRKAVEFFAGNFASGVSGQLRDTNTQRRIIESALPEGYTTGFDMARETISSVTNIKDEMIGEVKPLINSTKKLTESVLPKVESKLPPKLVEKLKNWAADRDDPYAYQAKSQNQMDREEVEGSVNEIFGAYIAQQEEQKELAEQKEDARQAINKVYQTKVDGKSLEHLASIRESTNRLSNYQDQVTIQFQRKLIDIQYWNLITARKSLDVQQQHLKMQEFANKDIVKNTALPDFVKMQNMEVAEAKLKEQFIGKMTEPLSRSFSTIGRRIVERTMPKMKEMTRDLGVRLLTAQNMVDQAGMVDQVGTADKVGMGIQGGSAMATHILTPWLGKLLKNRIGDNSKINTFGDTIQNVSDNAPRFLQELLKHNGSSGSNIIDLLRDFGDLNRETYAKSNVVQTSAISELDKQAVFNIQTRRTITDVIPGWLGRVHNEIRMLRTGTESEPDRFDFSTMKFESKQSIKDRFIKRTLGERNLNNIHQRTHAMINDLDEEGQLSEDAKTELQKYINTIAWDDSKRFSIVDMASGKSGIKGDIGDEITNFFRSKTGLTEDDFKNGDFKSKMKLELAQNPELQKLTKKANSGMEDLRLHTNLNSIQAQVIELAKLGHLDIAEELGLVTRNEQEGFSIARYNNSRLVDAVKEYEDGRNKQENETDDERNARLNYLRGGNNLVGPRMSNDGYHDADGNWKWWDSSRNKVENGWSTSNKLGRQVDRFRNRMKDRFDQLRGKGEESTESPSDESKSELDRQVDAVMEELKDSLSDKFELLIELRDNGTISKEVYKEAHKRLGGETVKNFKDRVREGINKATDSVKNKISRNRSNDDDDDTIAPPSSEVNLSETQEAIAEQVTRITNTSAYNPPQPRPTVSEVIVPEEITTPRYTPVQSDPRSLLLQRTRDIAKQSNSSSDDNPIVPSQPALSTQVRHLPVLYNPRAEMLQRTQDIANRSEVTSDTRLLPVPYTGGTSSDSQQSVETPVTTRTSSSAYTPPPAPAAVNNVASNAITNATQTVARDMNIKFDNKFFISQVDRIVAAIEAMTTVTEANNNDEGTELISSQLANLNDTVSNIPSVITGQPSEPPKQKGPGLIRRTGKLAKKGLTGLWNYHKWAYSKLWTGTKAIVSAPKRIFEATKAAFSKGFNDKTKWSYDKLAGMADDKKDVKKDLYIEGQTKPIILAANMETYATTKYLSQPLDDKGEETGKPKIVTRCSDIVGPVYEYQVGDMEATKKLIVSKDKLPKLCFADGKPAKSFLSKTIKWSLLGAGALLVGGLATAILPPALMAGATGYIMLKTIKAAKKAVQWMLNYTPDVYVGDETSPRLLGRIIRAGGYVNKTNGKVIRNINDITGEVVTSAGETVLSHDDLTKGLFDNNGKPIKGPLGKLVGLAMSTVGLPLKMIWGGAKLTGRYLKASYKAMGKGIKAIGSYIGAKTIGKVTGSVEKIKVAKKMVTTLEAIHKLLQDRLPGSTKPKFGDSDGDGDRDGSREDILASKKDDFVGPLQPTEDGKKEDEKKGLMGLLMGLVGGVTAGFAMLKKWLGRAWTGAKWLGKTVGKIAKGGKWIGGLLIKGGKAVASGIKGIIAAIMAKMGGGGGLFGGGKGKGGGVRAKAAGLLSKLGTKGKLAAGLLAAGGATYAMSGNASAAEPGVEDMENWSEEDYGSDPEAAVDNQPKSETPNDAPKEPTINDDPNKSMLDRIREQKGTGSLTDKAFGLASWIPGVGAVTDAVSGRERGMVDYAFDAMAAKAVISGVGKFAIGQGLRSAAVAGLSGIAGLVSAPVLIGVAAVAAVGAGAYYLYKRNKDNKATAVVTFRMAQYGFNLRKESYAEPITRLEELALKHVTMTGGKANIKDLPPEFLDYFKVNKKNEREMTKFATWFQARFKPIFLGAVTAYYELTGKTNLLDADSTLTKEQKLQLLQKTHITETKGSPYVVSASPFPKDENVKYDLGDVNEAYEKAVKYVNKLKDTAKDKAEAKDVEGKDDAKDKDKSSSWMKSTASAIKETMSRTWDMTKNAFGKSWEFMKGLHSGVGGVIDKGLNFAKDTVTSMQRGAVDAVFGKDSYDNAMDNMGEMRDKVASTAGGLWDKFKHSTGLGTSNQGSGEQAMLQAAKEAGINDANELAALMGTTAHESGYFKATSENLNYRAATLMKLWPHRFPTREKAEAIASGGPEAIANNIYGGRMGNNTSGDGWKYRGRGYIQLTGKANYEAFKKASGLDVVNNPDMLNEPAMAAKSAVYFWTTKKGLREAAQRGDITRVQKLVNGGMIGFDDRKKKIADYLSKIKSGTLIGGSSASAPVTTTNPTAAKSAATAAPAKANPTSTPAAPAKEEPGFLAKLAAPVTNTIKNIMGDPNPSTATKTPNSVNPNGAASVEVAGVPANIPKDHRAIKAATYATNKACGKSIGRCASYVATALLAAGYKFARNASAFMYATRGTMSQMGFKQINTSTYQIGDVAVWPAHGGPGGGGKHGHIQIFNGKNWVSDFIQRNFVPGQHYRSSTPSIWRDATLLDKNMAGAVVNGGKDATPEAASTTTDSGAPQESTAATSQPTTSDGGQSTNPHAESDRAILLNPFAGVQGYENYGGALKKYLEESKSGQVADPANPTSTPTTPTPADVANKTGIGSGTATAAAKVNDDKKTAPPVAVPVPKSPAETLLPTNSKANPVSSETKAREEINKTAVGALTSTKPNVTDSIVAKNKEVIDAQAREHAKQVETLLGEQLTVLRTMTTEVKKISKLMERMESRVKELDNKPRQTQQPVPESVTNNQTPPQQSRVGIVTPIDFKTY